MYVSVGVYEGVCLFVVVLHHSNSISVQVIWYEMRRTKPEPTLLLTQGISLTFQTPYRYGMGGYGLCSVCELINEHAIGA